MKTERSEAERKLGEILKEAIDQSTAELDLFAEMKPTVIPSPEIFMTDRSRYRKKWIAPAVGIIVGCSALILAFRHFKKN